MEEKGVESRDASGADDPSGANPTLGSVGRGHGRYDICGGGECSGVESFVAGGGAASEVEGGCTW